MSPSLKGSFLPCEDDAEVRVSEGVPSPCLLFSITACSRSFVPDNPVHISHEAEGRERTSPPRLLCNGPVVAQGLGSVAAPLIERA